MRRGLKSLVRYGTSPRARDADGRPLIFALLLGNFKAGRVRHQAYSWILLDFASWGVNITERDPSGTFCDPRSGQGRATRGPRSSHAHGRQTLAERRRPKVSLGLRQGEREQLGGGGARGGAGGGGREGI